jgi:hypothetical protein
LGHEWREGFWRGHCLFQVLQRELPKAWRVLGCIFFFFFELTALHWLGRYSTSWAIPLSSFFLADWFSQFCPWPALDFTPPAYASQRAGITDVHHHAQLLRWDR